MKTKYIAVPVSERLPEKEGCYPIIFKNSDIIRYYYRAKDVLSEEFWKNNIEYWLEEKEDHSEEMFSMLGRLISHYEDVLCDDFSPMALRSDLDLTKELINKVKDNG
ncbi:hypothetical protein [Elizabethkingia anophelis]|uniref:hypothetical protein n=1 Tax=Elizabethkingia anophelis TaxID=1117645 RepID=UPI003892AAA3